MRKKKTNLTTRDVITGTLDYISEEAYRPWGNMGFVDVRIHWIKNGVPEGYWKPTQQVLVNNGLVRVGYGRSYDLELTAWAYLFLAEQGDPFALKNEDNKNKAFEFSNEFKEHCSIGLCHRSWIAIQRFLVVRWFGSKVRDNPWWQLIITGLFVGLIVVVLGEIAKHYLFCILHW